MDTELASHMGDNAGGYLGGIGEKSSEKTGGDELQGEAKPVMLTPATADERQVIIVEVEVTGELERRRFTGVPAITAFLLFGKEINRHGVFLVMGLEECYWR
jgi:hypothetical protein